MLRDKWEFEYTGAQLSEAAARRITFHQERVQWWTEKRRTVMAQIRAEGLEVNEKLVMGYQNPKSRDWSDATQLTIRNDLKLALAECHLKLSNHTKELEDFRGWYQVLKANPEARKTLDLEDWLHFFSAPGGVDEDGEGAAQATIPLN